MQSPERVRPADIFADITLIPKSMRRLLIWQQRRCYLCACKMNYVAYHGWMHDQRFATFDHVVPRKWGGKRGGNVLLACRACNTAKADRIPTVCEMFYLREAYRPLEGQ